MERQLEHPNLQRGGPGRKRTPGGQIGILLNRLMLEKGWNIRQYAEIADFEYQRIQEYVSGKYTPKLETLTKLLAPFGLKAQLVPAIIEIRDIATNRMIENLSVDRAGPAGTAEGADPEVTMANQPNGD
jgi:transcriptional regulator with XRE-family HTH domain